MLLIPFESFLLISPQNYWLINEKTNFTPILPHIRHDRNSLVIFKFHLNISFNVFFNGYTTQNFPRIQWVEVCLPEGVFHGNTHEALFNYFTRREDSFSAFSWRLSDLFVVFMTKKMLKANVFISFWQLFLIAWKYATGMFIIRYITRHTFEGWRKFLSSYIFW